MTLIDLVKEFFKEDGLLSKYFENYEFREAQYSMALEIARMFEYGGIYLIEAGTGTGKTFAYLIPAILSGQRVVISTKTRSLQEQLFFKDLMKLNELFKFNPEAVMIKGRSNYICLKRAQKLFEKSIFRGEEIEIIKKWLDLTDSGDLSELNEIYSNKVLMNMINSSSDTCFGYKCEFFKRCFVNRLRIKAEKSDILIVNHHLLFSDLKIKYGGFGKVLPEYRYLICDEAHSIEEIATAHFGESLSKFQLYFIISEIEEFDKRIANELKILTDELFSHFKGNLRMSLYEFDVESIKLVANKIIEKFQESIYEIDDERLINKIDELILKFDKVFFSEKRDFIKWVDFGIKNITIYYTPIDISSELSEFFYSLNGVCFTSATLSINGNFDYIKFRLGLKETSSEKIFPSPFDYKNRVLLYIPEDIPDPFDERFVEVLCNHLINLIRITDGNALILFTSLKNLNDAGKILKNSIDNPLFIQGESSNYDLIENFKHYERAVLLGSYSFWEGIDIEPENIRLVAIDKLPFSPPNDPVKIEKINLLKEEGRNPFLEYQIPEAIMFLRQGFGRLIRSSQHRGILALLDNRIFTKSYGKIFLQNLPQIEIVSNLKILNNRYKKLVS